MENPVDVDAASPSRNEEGRAAGAVERALGKRPSDWTEADVVDLVFERGIRLVSLMHVGGDGWLKTLDFVPRDRFHLEDVVAGGERADGSSLFHGLGIRSTASDILLRPRLDTAFIDPFSEVPTLVLLCSHADRQGRPLSFSPSVILRRAQDRVRKETGVDLWALGEVEFFLGKRRSEGDIYGADDRGYHASSPFVFGEGLRRRALAILADMGIPVKYGHSEVGYIEADGKDHLLWEQHEIELTLSPLQEAARYVLLTQWVLRNLAHRSGMMCSFAPIVREGHAGNGLHFHLSPRTVQGEFRVRDASGFLVPEAKWLIGGLARLGGALMAFGNRSDSSFLRLSQAKEAPRSISWGEYDRSALIRLPMVATRPDGRPVAPPTIEFRLPDGSAHPYLLLAGVAQAMVQGRSEPDIDVVLEESSAARGAVAGASPLPAHPHAVALALEANRSALEAGGVFPSELVDELLEKLGGRVDGAFGALGASGFRPLDS